jgi:hypothetical protein
MTHEYTLKASRCAISPSTSYGYWERKDGSEGGGLWFDGMSLSDYDGAFSLPKDVCDEIAALGYTVAQEFYP